MAAVDILHLLDQLEEEVASARKMPMGSGVLVDRKRLLDLIDQLRVAIPANIRQARDVMAHRERLVQEAEQESRNLMLAAQQEAQRRLAEDALVAQARAEAERLVREAQARGQQLVREAQQRAEQENDRIGQEAQQHVAAADDYAYQLLSRLDKQISAFLANVRASLDSMQGPPG